MDLLRKLIRETLAAKSKRRTNKQLLQDYAQQFGLHFVFDSRNRVWRVDDEIGNVVLSHKAAEGLYAEGPVFVLRLKLSRTARQKVWGGKLPESTQTKAVTRTEIEDAIASGRPLDQQAA